MIKLSHYLLSILLTFIIAFYLGRASENVTYIDNTVKSDTTPRVVEHTKEYFYYDTLRIVVIPDTIREGAKIDTNFILNEYFTKHSIEDSIDTMDVRAKIRSTLYGNEIISNVWTIQNTRKTTLTSNNPKLFIGMVYDQTFQPALLYTPKRIGYYGQFDWKEKEIKAGLFYRLK